jgi:two-component system response regulator HydG
MINKSILVVDDDVNMCSLMLERLSKRDFYVETRNSAEEALLLLQKQEFDVVITDVKMPVMNGIELCEKIVGHYPNIPVIVITGFGDLNAAIGAIRAGAYDFINKPFQIEEIIIAINRALQHRTLREEVKRLQQAVLGTQQFAHLIGHSNQIKELFHLMERVADTDASVLIRGESGTGKELVARALHQRSSRKDGPFVAISCAALPEHLLESELFGHKKGAFTDARNTRDGLLVQANTGTLFLDEIGDMPLNLQPKLLRALEERKVRPLGSNTEISFDIRLLAATNRDLEYLIDQGLFREDLYYRLNVVMINSPDLKNRGNDVLLLAQHFIKEFSVQMSKQVDGLSVAAADKLLKYKWPGNVRELKNCMERAVALAQHDKLTVEDLPDKIRNYESSYIVIAGNDQSDLVSMEEVEKRYITKVMEAVNNNRTQAAQILGFDRKTLYRKLRRYGLDSSETSLNQ